MFNKIKVTISTVFGTVLWESEKETVKEAVIEKYMCDANLYGANLRDANLRDANLYGANLYGANLRDANLYGANLYGANLRDANLRGANLYGANLRDANLRGANLYGANLRDAKDLPKSYINFCSRDMLFIFEHLKGELPFLRDKLVKGEVNGTQYAGECCCLIGTLANADGGIENVCSMIPFYEKGLENPAEQWFWQIRIGDTPENSLFAKHAVELIDSVLKPAKKSKKKVSN